MGGGGGGKGKGKSKGNFAASSQASLRVRHAELAAKEAELAAKQARLDAEKLRKESRQSNWQKDQAMGLPPIPGMGGKADGKPWCCMVKGCSWAETQKPNLSFRTKCGCCATPKSSAMNPAKDKRVQLQQKSPSVSLKQQQKKTEEATKRQAGEAMTSVWGRPNAQPPLSVEEPGAPRSWPVHPPAPTHNVLTTQLQQPPAKNLQDAFQQAFPEGRPARDSLHDVGVLDLLPALQPLLASLKEEGLPDDLSPEPDEEKVKSTVSSLFQGVHATATLSGIADAERATERCWPTKTNSPRRPTKPDKS